MNSPLNPIQKITILGGGTSGWMAAAMLAVHLNRTRYRIELIESDDIGTVGVGESTIPSMVQLLHNLGIDEQDFIRETQACYKLGIRFVDWKLKGHHYFHPYGALGKALGGQDFYACWLKAKLAGDPSALQDFSPCAVMAEQARFFLPSQAAHTPIGGAGYALHVDAKQVAAYLRRFAEARGVVRSEAVAVAVQQRSNGFIERIVLADGRSVSGDFFIDCSGFKALLIEQTLRAGFDDWSSCLPCDRAIAVKTQALDARLPYTTAQARKAGWSWRIPLRNSTGHGYVYASRFCSDSEAKSTLLRHLDATRINDPRVIQFTTGRRKLAWKANCLALGLAAGFIEPLESTAIHLIARGMDVFLRYFPDADCDPALAREYNRRLAEDYEEVRDFVILHYCATQRDDTAFWRWCKTMPLPDSLAERIALFKGHGVAPEGGQALFRASNWQSIFEGMGVRPHKYAARADNVDTEFIQETLRTAKSAIATMVKTLPTHDEYLQQHYGVGQLDP